MAKSVVEQTVANIDAQIADLQRARTLVLAAAADAAEPVGEKPKKRGRKKRNAGLPAAEDETTRMAADGR